MAEEGQRQRLEKAERFLETARLCLREGDFESCVSRAYYALFHSIHLLLKEEGTIESHVELIRSCVRWNRVHTRLSSTENLRGNKGLESSLRTLHRWRNNADYDIGMITRERAQNALDFARRFLANVKEIIT